MNDRFARENAEAESMTARRDLKRHKTIARNAIKSGLVWWDTENRVYLSRDGRISEEEARRRLRDISVRLFEEIPLRSTVYKALLYIIDYFTKIYKENYHDRRKID